MARRLVLLVAVAALAVVVAVATTAASAGAVRGIQKSRTGRSPPVAPSPHQFSLRPATSLAEAAAYTPKDGKFTCLNGERTVDFASVNDDYCDCADGSDEPG
jgi:hypothetical protein